MASLISASVPLAGPMAALCCSGSAWAAGPRPWQMGLQPAASPVMERTDAVHDLLLVVVSVIVGLVMALLLYVVIRYREKANPTPTATTHNTPIEVAWTVVPAIILLVIAVPSFRLLYYMDRAVDPEMTVKATGSQWYWSYEYPDHGGIAFDSQMVPAAALQPGQPRLLAVDRRMVVPVDTNIRVLVTANVVIHSWAVPSLGIKTDAIPGRINETWMRIAKPGVYYGQCSELCGIGHAFMPIAVEAVSKAEFKEWVAARGERSRAARESPPGRGRAVPSAAGE